MTLHRFFQRVGTVALVLVLVGSVEAAEWKVKPDALAAPIKVSEDAKTSLTLANPPTVVFPSTPSSFVAVGQKSRAVHDLRTMKSVGTISNVRGPNVVLSADGVHLATQVIASKQQIEVWTVATNQSTTIDLDPPTAYVRDFDFAGPGRLLIATSVKSDVQYRVYDIKTGKEVAAFLVPVDHDRKKRGFSANGRYLAVPERLDVNENFTVRIYDLTDGTLAGTVTTAVAANTAGCRGLAFAPDGKSLSALLSAVKDSSLVTWDLTTGMQTSAHKIDKDLQPLGRDIFNTYQGTAIEWLPDGGGWILFGRLLLDSTNGTAYWKIPTTPNEVLPRRLFDSNRFVTVRNQRTLTLDSLPADAVTARTAARGGADSGKVPTVVKADYSAAKKWPVANAAAPWRGEADPGTTPKEKFTAQPIPLRNKVADVQRILFTRPDLGQAAVVVATTPNPLNLSRPVRVERFDLVSGKPIDGVDLCTVEATKGRTFLLDTDLSPDGSAILLKDPKDELRVDVWSLPEGKHVAGWAPYEKDRQGNKLRWAAFLDAKRVLTLSEGARLVLWTLPECKAVYVHEHCYGPPTFSPGRKYLVLRCFRSIELLDPATGERRGTLQDNVDGALLAGAFRPDGKELAAIVHSGKQSLLCRWDATTGASLGRFAVSPSLTPIHVPMHWCDADHVFWESTLYDLTVKGGVTRYSIWPSHQAASGSPDGQLWHASARMRTQPAMLVARTVPDEAAKEVAQLIKTNAGKVVVGVGTAVAVRVEGAGPAKDGDKFRKQVADYWTNNLEAQGIKVADDAPVTLLITFQPERDTGEMRPYLEKTGVVKLPVQEVACQLTLRDGQGILVEQKQAIKTPDFPGMPRGEDLKASLNESLWRDCSNWATSPGQVPAFVVRTGTGILVLPKPTTLTPER